MGALTSSVIDPIEELITNANIALLVEETYMLLS